MNDASAVSSDDPEVDPVYMRWKQCLKIVKNNDRTFSVLGDGLQTKIRREGVSVTDFGAGWSPSFVYAGSWPLLLLELKHDDGHEATWFLDAEMNILREAFPNLNSHYRDLLRNKVMRGFESLLNFVLWSVPEPALCDQGFLHINPNTLRQILESASYNGEGRTAVTWLDELPDSIIQESLGSKIVKLSSKYMRLAMDVNIIDVAAKTIRNNCLHVISPVDGRELRSNISICISNFIFAYRFCDDLHSLPFFLIASTHVCKTVAFYFPLTNQCVSVSRGEANALSSQLPYRSIDKALREHVMLFGLRLLPYLQSATRQIATLCWHGHLGHHLWQDLTGLEALDRELRPEELPPVLVMRASQSEMFGPIDTLYPNLVGQVDRTGHDVRPLLDLVYRRKLCLISPGGFHITRSLTERINTFAIKAPDLEDDRRLLSQLKSSGLPIVLLGLRVENRTVVNFPQFCEELVEVLRDETKGQLAIIIDGHNSNGVHVFESAGPRGQREPIAIERSIVANLQRRFADTDLIFIDTIGAKMHRSIFWSQSCDFFVTPWGAGLAKYQWIARKPGLVLAGELYQKKGFDLHIYDDPLYLEDPMPMTILDILDVKDAPEDTPLIAINELQRCNFRVNIEGIRRKIQDLLANKSNDCETLTQ